MPSRRDFIQASAIGILASLTGCSAIRLPRPKMDFSVENFRNETIRLGVRFFRPNVTERSEALVYRNQFEIPPRENADGPWTVEDVAPDRPYRIEIEVGDTWNSHHYHYQPDCSDNEPYEIGVLVTLYAGGGVRFTQTTCSSDSLFL
ncbi:twin-arginine translocation signal domain-containing protein [Natronorubrum halophilum]|uniref:twin-arginine translocation signal domain-containing protein n=1 Tax=Natronorubrum halophilum TaxID=1702106 RepID=UPI0010C202AF|nr:twin-arginine translocation signal domain-containing protein [Natronorubrum halophilum]